MASRQPLLRWKAGLLAVFLLLPAAALVEGSDSSSEVPLAQLVEEFERTEQEIASIQGRLEQKSLSAAERQALQRQREDLQRKQEELLDRLERVVGPPPSSVLDRRSRSSQEKLQQDQTRQEAVQEKDVERRLP